MRTSSASRRTGVTDASCADEPMRCSLLALRPGPLKQPSKQVLGLTCKLSQRCERSANYIPQTAGTAVGTLRGSVSCDTRQALLIPSLRLDSKFASVSTYPTLFRVPLSSVENF